MFVKATSCSPSIKAVSRGQQKSLAWVSKPFRPVIHTCLCLFFAVSSRLCIESISASSACRSSDITLEPYETEIIEQSTPWTLALAKHLNSIGAKMYGAFWCSHCMEQKQMFGREAAKILNYIECFPDGVGKGRKMTQECTLAGLEGFPTWIIKGKVLSGEQNLQALADASEFVSQDSSYELASKQD